MQISLAIWNVVREYRQGWALIVFLAIAPLAARPPMDLDLRPFPPRGHYPGPLSSLLKRVLARIGRPPISKLDSFNFTLDGGEYTALLWPSGRSLTICRLRAGDHCAHEQLDLSYESRDALYVLELTNTRGCGLRILAFLDQRRVPLRAETGEIIRDPWLFSWECGYRTLRRAEIVGADGRVYDYANGLALDEADGRVQTLPLLSPAHSHILSPELIPAEMDLHSPLYDILLQSPLFDTLSQEDWVDR